MKHTLSEKEHSRLTALEEVIGHGLETFLDVGRSLLEIRDKKLYRAAHTTFEHYCRARWQLGRAYAYRLIGAAQIAADLASSLVQPTAETQLRPLSGLPGEQVLHVWRSAVEEAGGVPTEDIVRRALESLPAETQKRLIEEAEDAALAPDVREKSATRPHEGRKRRLEGIRRHIESARRLAEGLGGEGDALVAAFAGPLHEIDRLQECV